LNPTGATVARSRAQVDGRTYAVRLTIPAKAEYIALGRLALSGLSRLRPLSDEVLGDLKLALTEACTNSVQHAYRGGDGSVEILYELHADRLVIEVSDSGEGFEGQGADSLDLSELTEGGLGIAIIRSLADDLQIDAREGGGSRLRFVKVLES
jgi:serine/threonine-protein kinase RsbW